MKNREREDARRLRLEDRLSNTQISRRLGVAKSTVAVWLRDMPLKSEEIAKKLGEGGRTSAPVRSSRSYRRTVPASPLACLAGDTARYTTAQLGKIAEAACALRLCVLGAEIFSPVFAGDRVDFVAVVAGRALKVQVKWALPQKQGRPTAALRRSNGRQGVRRYEPGDFDVLIAYCLFEDAAYVWLWDEVRDASGVTCALAAREAWGKIPGLYASG